MKTQAQMIAILSAAFPQGNFVPASDFYGRPNEGIWIRGDFDIDGLPHIDAYSNHPDYHFWAHPKLHEVVSEHGWHCEAHDSGTMMVYN